MIILHENPVDVLLALSLFSLAKVTENVDFNWDARVIQWMSTISTCKIDSTYILLKVGHVKVPIISLLYLNNTRSPLEKQRGYMYATQLNHRNTNEFKCCYFFPTCIKNLYVKDKRLSQTEIRRRIVRG